MAPQVAGRHNKRLNAALVVCKALIMRVIPLCARRITDLGALVCLERVA